MRNVKSFIISGLKKKLLFFFYLLFFFISVFSFCSYSIAENAADKNDKSGKEILKDQKDKVSYSIGLDIGRNLQNQAIEINPEIFLIGIRHAFSGGKTLLTEKEINEVMSQLQKEMMEKQEVKRKIEAEKNIKEGETFLSENKKKKDIQTTASGLQYKILTRGKGTRPKSDDLVEVHYKGQLINGTEFDNSYKRGEPAVFYVSEVIQGWTEALQLMAVGSKWELYIPAKLAYGEHGAGPIIGPNATLHFTVELISIKKEEQIQNQ